MSNFTHNEAEANKRPTSGSVVVDRVNRKALPSVFKARKASDELREHDRQKILTQARFHARNDGLLKEIKILFATYAIGQGLKLQLGGGDDSWKKQAYDLWEEWCEMPEISGRFTLPEIETFCCNALGDDGDIFLALIYDTEKKGRPWLQIIESHQVGGSGDFENGIIKDATTGQPLEYIIRDDQGEEKRYPAHAILHLALFERFSSDRGTPDFETAVPGVYDRAEFERLTMTKAQQQATRVQAVTQDLTKADPWGDDDGEGRITFDDDGQPVNSAPDTMTGNTAPPVDEETRYNEEVGRTVSERIGGETIVLPGGLDIKNIGNDTPGATFEAYIEHRMMMDSMGLILKHFFCPEKLGGASLRAVLAQTDAKIVFRRQMPIIRPFRKLVRWWLACMIDNGSLPFVPDFDKVDFQTPARITADYGRDAKADREDIAAGIQSYEDNFQGRGLDFKTQMLQNIEALKWLKETCAEYDVDPAEVFPIAFQNAAKAAPAPAPGEPTEPADDAEPQPGTADGDNNTNPNNNTK